MILRQLGTTGIQVSALAFGAGPVPALMTAGDDERAQRTVARAIDAGINWFDTAATYGNGQSERSLGHALRQLDASQRVHIATKVRLTPEQVDDPFDHVRASVEGSLARLGVPRVTLLQLHNSITAKRGDEPTSVTPADILRPGGILDAMRRVQSAGLALHIGLTGIGQPAAMREVIGSGAFATMQTPYHLLNPSAGRAMPAGFAETDYGDVIESCAGQRMGVFAIRVFAGGALAGHAPSEHTKKTLFFPLDLYERDRRRAASIADVLRAPGLDVKEAALRFAAWHGRVSSAIVGFGAAEHVDEAVAYLNAGPLPPEVLMQIDRA